jgi:hypothetical protein
MLTYGVRFQFRGLVLDAPLGECPLRQGPVARSIASLPSDTRYRSHVHADAQDHRRAVEIIVAPATTATREYLQYRNIQPSREYVRQCFESMFITKGVSHAVAELGKACAFHLPRREAEIALKDELVYIQFLTSSIFVMSPLPLLLASPFASRRYPWNARSSSPQGAPHCSEAFAGTSETLSRKLGREEPTRQDLGCYQGGRYFSAAVCRHLCPLPMCTARATTMLPCSNIDTGSSVF